MTKKFLTAVATVALGTAMATPAHATWWTTLTHKHYCNCGHAGQCGGTSTGGTTTGGTTTGGTTTGGTAVPEPGMLGMMALGLLGIGFARSRKVKPRA